MTSESTAARVDSHVHIGGYVIASDPRYVRENGITHIVKMFADDKEYKGGYHRHPGVTYLVLDTEDWPDFDMQGPAFTALKFIQAAIKKGGKILVHCHAGISRSATIVLIYLMIYKGFDLDTALTRLRMVRPQANPNAGFMEYLKAVDGKLRRVRASKNRRTQPPQARAAPIQGTRSYWVGGGGDAGRIGAFGEPSASKEKSRRSPTLSERSEWSFRG